MKETKIKNKIRGAYFTSLVSISMVMLLIGIILTLVLNAKYMSSYVKENLCFSLIIRDDVKEPDIKRYQKILDSYEFIKSTKYIRPEEAAEILQKDLGENFIETLGSNPLSPTINVYLKSDYTEPDSIANIEQLFLAQTEYVSEVSYQQNLVHLINDNVKKISLLIFIFCGALLIISFSLLNNTIRLMIYSKRVIINTMKLIGAKPSFIRRPFIMSGILQGVFGSLVAIGLLSLIFYLINQQIGEVVIFIDKKIIIVIFGIILLCGIVLTCISTFISVQRHLRNTGGNMQIV